MEEEQKDYGLIWEVGKRNKENKILNIEYSHQKITRIWEESRFNMRGIEKRQVNKEGSKLGWVMI